LKNRSLSHAGFEVGFHEFAQHSAVAAFQNGVIELPENEWPTGPVLQLSIDFREKSPERNFGNT
jgi:hypothetical protein